MNDQSDRDIKNIDTKKLMEWIVYLGEKLQALKDEHSRRLKKL